ncbi:bifunctional 2-polyprenyl-6-hydroxyphenol methylase/3-demethylubiquinol 3-O-methyltransferase UbiG [Nocardioides sp. SYSU D00038]|uniref:class I SAM-dependent methyltransferase n=1 Tax=Nocardioides sp. SYSU D00038 TaxID=2812554 RepID=UPI0019674264|nr:class I SAM-dependent methyltransferase [Nocardioides sp. SYSU D00038]
MSLPDDSFTTVFSAALRGRPCAVVGLDDAPQPLPVPAWLRAADADDLALLERCQGPTLDVGCGPGRLSAALAERGGVVLGIDVVHEAVSQTQDRGVAALHRDVFDVLPGEGRWMSVLLADGNVGIGGDPEHLLTRLRELIDPRGRLVVEVAAPGVPDRAVWARLECEGIRSRPFRWAVVGADGVTALARRVGLRVTELAPVGERWCAVLEEAA